MSDHDEYAYPRALKEVATLVEVLIYRREDFPIRNRGEVRFDLAMRLLEIRKDSKDKRTWRRVLLDLAAYAVFAAVNDEGEE